MEKFEEIFEVFYKKLTKLILFLKALWKNGT